MKKLLLFSLILSLGLASYSQFEPIIVKNGGTKSIAYDAVNDQIDGVSEFTNPNAVIIRGTANLGPTETRIGTTLYDLFSNYNTGNRFYRYDDGTMAGVFMLSLESGFADRGTGYNYYDGTAWGPEPTVRIENMKTGWPNIAPLEAGEIGFAHNGVSGLEYIIRPEKGTGDWTQTNFLGPEGIEDDITWPRCITTGENNEVIHMIVNTYGEWMGQLTTFVYSRSSDGGQTWDPQNAVIDEMGEDYYIQLVQDKCVMAANGNSVAILYADAWTDLFYVRSDDNGDTWERTVVWEYPIPFFDPDTYDPAVQTLDTCFVPDYSGHLTIDDDGHVHVVFGICRVIADEGGASLYYNNPFWEGIGYWNDMMEPFSNSVNALAPPKYNEEETELVVDETYIGYLQDVDGDGVITIVGDYPARTYGMSTYPSITVDQYGRRFVIWAANTETQVYTGGDEDVNYKRIWARAYANGAWGNFMDLTADIAHIFDQCTFPMIASTSDEFIHYIYQADLAPGNSLDGDHEETDNYWIYGMLPKTDLLTGVAEMEVINDSHVSQNFPNPFSNTSTVTVDLQEASNLSLVVTNMTGQKVLEINKGNVAAQTHTFTIDASNFQSGIYFYTVTAGDSQVTRKMIVE